MIGSTCAGERRPWRRRGVCSGSAPTTLLPPARFARYMAASAAASATLGPPASGIRTTPTDIVTPAPISTGSSATARVARVSAAWATASVVAGRTTTNSSPP